MRARRVKARAYRQKVQAEVETKKRRWHEMDQKRQRSHNSRHLSQRKEKQENAMKEASSKQLENDKLNACENNPCPLDSQQCVIDWTNPPFYQCLDACLRFDLQQCPPSHGCRPLHHQPLCVDACRNFKGCLVNNRRSKCIGRDHKPKCTDPCFHGGKLSGNQLCAAIRKGCVPDKRNRKLFRCLKCAVHRAGPRCGRMKALFIGNVHASHLQLEVLTFSSSDPRKLAGHAKPMRELHPVYSEEPGIVQMDPQRVRKFRAYGLDVDRSGSVYLTSGHLGLVYKLTRNASGGLSLPQIFAKTRIGAFTRGVRVSPDSSFLYVTSSSTNEIYYFRLIDGSLIKVWRDDRCSGPAGLTFHLPSRKLFVACSGKSRKEAAASRIIALDAALNSSDTWISNHTLLRSPQSLAFDSDNNLFIATSTVSGIGSVLLKVSPQFRQGATRLRRRGRASSAPLVGYLSVTEFSRDLRGRGVGVEVDAFDNVYWSLQASRGQNSSLLIKFTPDFNSTRASPGYTELKFPRHFVPGPVRYG